MSKLILNLLENKHQRTPKGQSKMDNLEKLKFPCYSSFVLNYAICIGILKFNDKQTNALLSIKTPTMSSIINQRTPKGQSKMDNLEKLTKQKHNATCIGHHHT
jgi:hypothetical protein